MQNGSRVWGCILVVPKPGVLDRAVPSRARTSPSKMPMISLGSAHFISLHLFIWVVICTDPTEILNTPGTVQSLAALN